MGVEFIVPVKVSVNTNTMFNFDSDFKDMVMMMMISFVDRPSWGSARMSLSKCQTSSFTQGHF